MSRAVKVSFDSLCLAAVVSECQSFLGGRIQKIYQPDDFTLYFEIYSGSTYWFCVSCHPEMARAHLSSRKPRSSGEMLGFCASLRKHLSGGRVTKVSQRGTDRILELGMESAEGKFVLIAELMGKHSNLMLVDMDGIVLSAAKWVGKNQSKRPIQAKKPYLPPPFEPKRPLTDATDSTQLDAFEGVSPLIRRLISAGEELDSIQAVFKDAGSGGFLFPGVGAYPLDLSRLGLEGVHRESFSHAVEQAFAERESGSVIHHVKSDLLGQLGRILQARRSALAGLDGAIAAADRASETQMAGELILAYQGSIQTGDIQLAAFDYEGNPVTIELDPELSPVENANRRFDKARKAKDRVDEVREHRTRILDNISDLESALGRVESAESVAELTEVKDEAKKRRWLHAGGAPKPKEERPFEGFSIRELLAPGGWRVLYGTNATSNDYLTSRFAKGNDYWFHVRGQTSAHVILVTQGKPEKVQKPDIEFAAIVAAKNSVAKHSTHVAVDYTLKKYVRKPRGSVAGLAVYEREKTIHVDPTISR